ncbi:MAG: hypothetical protein HUK25_05640, partial [Treponema sp.]|nr:hypothetical protein [Treponema sp.]
MKNKFIIKLSLLFALVLYLLPVVPAFSQERAKLQFIVNGDFSFDLPLQGEDQKNTMGKIDMGFGGALGLELRPFKHVGFLAQAEYHSFSVEKNLLDSFNVLSANIGAGARIPLTGALSLNGDVYAGVYSSTHGTLAFSGFDAGVKISVRYSFAPSLNVGVGTGFGSYIHKDFPINYLPITAGVSFNLTEFLASEQNVSGDLSSLEPVFPSLYSWYAENSFGTAVIENFEADEITNVKVYFYMEQFMNKATLCGSIDKLRPGKSDTVELKAIFNPTILSNQDMTNTTASIIVEYNRLGKRFKVENSVNIPVYNPNAMSWDDDRRAAVFVSKNNSVAVEFAKYVASSVRPFMKENENENYQLAKALFGALTEYGMGYVIDPSSSYSANVGTTSIDFLQFPHQTLKFKAGDCDDLSILYCSLLESLGI